LFKEDGACDLVLSALQAHHSDAVVCQAAFQLTARLAQFEPNRLYFLENSVMSAIVDIMDSLKADRDVQLNACWALVELAAGDGWITFV
jgi:hypothetical protein